MRTTKMLTALIVALFMTIPAAAAIQPPASSPGLGQNDAGSGMDAPDHPSSRIMLESGIVYDGLLLGLPVDPEDWYAFEGEEDQLVEARLVGAFVCYGIFDSVGHELDFNCSGGYLEVLDLTVRLESDGLHFLRVYYLEAQPYRFAIGINEPAPSPLADPVWHNGQDDAGSGGDAPNVRDDRIEIASGERYAAELTGQPDNADWYAFEAQAGETIEVRLRSPGPLCYAVHDPSGSEMDSACSDPGIYDIRPPLTVVTQTTGTHYLEAGYFVAQPYTFSLGIDEPAPEPALPGPEEGLAFGALGLPGIESGQSALLLPDAVDEGHLMIKKPSAHRCKQSSANSYSCKGISYGSEGLCYVEWSDEDADADYSEESASIHEKTCVGASAAAAVT